MKIKMMQLKFILFYKYSKTSKIRTPTFRSTRLFEINFEQNGTREYDLFIIIVHIITYVWARKETAPLDVSFIHTKHVC